MKKLIWLTAGFAMPLCAMANDAALKIPDSIKEHTILYYGFLVTGLGMLFGLSQYMKVKKLPAHQSMLDISEVIYQTCKAYLKQQGKFLAILFLFIGAAVASYFGLVSGDVGVIRSRVVNRLVRLVVGGFPLDLIA